MLKLNVYFIRVVCNLNLVSFLMCNILERPFLLYRQQNEIHIFCALDVTDVLIMRSSNLSSPLALFQARIVALPFAHVESKYIHFCL